MGSRFATDGQALTIDRPTRRRRLPVVFEPLCTAHARSGFIVEASFQPDPEIPPVEADAQSPAADEDAASTAFRRHARLWTKAEFDAPLDRLTRNAGLTEADVHGLPSAGSMIRHDGMQFAHAMRLRDHIGGQNVPLVFAMDGDAGLEQSSSTVFQPGMAAGKAHLAIVGFDKGMTNDKRNMVVADGRNDPCAATGPTSSGMKLVPSEFHAGIVDGEAACRPIGKPVGAWFDYPFPTKSDPIERVLLVTDSPDVSARSKARPMRLATLRGVDGCAHHWMEPGGDKQTPATRIGPARGRVFERDLS